MQVLENPDGSAALPLALALWGAWRLERVPRLRAPVPLAPARTGA